MNTNARAGAIFGGTLAVMAAVMFMAASSPSPSGTGYVTVINGVTQPVAIVGEAGTVAGFCDGGVPCAAIPSGGPLGVVCTSAYCAGENVSGWQWVDAGSTSTLWSIAPAPFIGTTVHVVADFPTQLIGNSNYAGNGYSRLLWFGIASPLDDGGVQFSNFSGGGATVTDSEYGSLMGSVTPSIVQCDSGLCGTISCSTNCAASSSISYNTWPIDLFDSGISDAGPPPTLAALTSPFLMTAAGGGQAVTLTGTNLTASATTVAVCGAFASGVTASGTSVTFTWPTGVAEDQSCNIVTSTPAGSATLSTGGCSTCAAVYVLSANVTNVWYAAEFYDSGTQTWTDLVGGLTATPPGSPFAVVPTYSATWSNGQPGFVQSAQQGFANTTITLTQPDSIFVFGNSTTTTGDTYYFDGNGAGRQLLRDDFNTPQIYAGTFFSNVLSNGTPAWVECDFNGASSAILVNNVTGTPSTGNAGTNTLSPGINLGFGNGGAASIAGGYGVFVMYEGSPTTGERAFMNSIFNLIY
jgi:hypothetical protein